MPTWSTRSTTALPGGPMQLPTGLTSKTPTDNIQKLNTRYNTVYLPGLQKAGVYDPHIAKQLYAYDLNRVKSNKAELSQSQFINAYHALHKNTAITQKKDSTDSGIDFNPIHLFTNAISDVGNIAGSLIPTRLVPAMMKEAASLFTLPAQLGQVHSLEDVVNLPGVRDIPGAYTANNLLTGNFGNMWRNPVSTVLDVLPYASKMVTVGAAAKFDELTRLDPAVKEASLAVTHAAQQLTSVHNEIISLKNAHPGFDLQHANFTKAKLDKAEKDFNSATDTLKNAKINAIGEKSTLQARLEGKPLRAASRATGVSSHVLEPAAKWIGADKAVRESAQMLAIKMRGHALILPSTKLSYDKMMTAQETLHDMLKYQHAGLKKILATPHTPAEVLRQQEIYKQYRGEFRKAVLKEWVAQFGRIYGHTVGEEFNFKMDEKGALVDGENKLVTDANLFTKWKTRGVYSSLNEFANSWGLLPGEIKQVQDALGIEPGHIMVPSYMVANLKLLNPLEKKGFARTTESLLDVFRESITLRPQHIIHVLASNATMTLLEHGVEPFMHFNEARRMLKNPGDWPDGLAQRSKLSAASAKADVYMSIAQGKTLARWWNTVKDAATHGQEFEEFVNNMFAAMNFLDGAKKGLSDAQLASIRPYYERWGVQLSPEHAAGLESVRRTTMNLDSMSPIERTIIRNIMPFYAYQRMLFQFLSRFPSDHPVRAALLAAYGRQETDNWATGLPQRFLDIFPLGSMDQNGNVLTVDTKNVNPFRTLTGYNPFTVAGFLSALNPAIQFPMEIVGTNVVTATPELYPNLTVDMNTGSLVAQHSDWVGKLLTTFVPETQAIDAYVNFSGGYKNLTGDARLHAVLNAVGLPFVPQNYNLYTQRINFAQNQYTEAQREVTSALQTGNLPPTAFTRLPVRNRYLTPDQVRQLLSDLKAIRKQQGTSDKLTQYLGAAG